MITHDHNPATQDPDGLPDALRWQLRGLRREAMPQRDLWAGISARIAAESQAAQPAPAANVVALPARPRRKLGWLAMAASLTLAVGLVWQLRPAGVAPAESDGFASVPHVDPTTAILISREASAMTWEYKAALREIDAHGVPVSDPRALRQLDRSAAQVRSALAEHPDSRFLLERLQKLYAQRLALTQRLALS